MEKVLELLTVTLPLINSLTKTNDKREQRRNIRSIKKNRRKIYKVLKKDGLNEEEKEMLQEIDHAWVQATIRLGKF
jgi:valyl-tRNA synthetase